jgi:hypothetical protein
MYIALAAIGFLLVLIAHELRSTRTTIQLMHLTLFKLFWYGSKAAQDGVLISALMPRDFWNDWREAAEIKSKK